MAILGSKTGDTGFPNILWQKSTTWSPATSMECIVYVIGGGGSGAISAENANYSATGAGAGATAISRLRLSSSVTYTVTVGAGGAGHTSDAHQAGNAGANSGFSGSDITDMTANGGAAGAIHSGAGGSGGAGGAAGSTGNIANWAGGAGGTTTSTRSCTGGGAVGLWATGLTPTEESGTGDNGYPVGGNLSHYDRGGVAREPSKPTDYLYPLPVSLTPFPELFTYLQSDQNAYISGTNYNDAPLTYQAGMQHVGEGLYPQGFTTSAIQFSAMPSPFIGGNGNKSSYTHIYGSKGCMGSGSGAIASNDTTMDAYAGAGGNGAVMLFPITL